MLQTDIEYLSICQSRPAVGVCTRGIARLVVRPVVLHQPSCDAHAHAHALLYHLDLWVFDQSVGVRPCPTSARWLSSIIRKALFLFGWCFSSLICRLGQSIEKELRFTASC